MKVAKKLTKSRTVTFRTLKKLTFRRRNKLKKFGKVKKVEKVTFQKAQRLQKAEKVTFQKLGPGRSNFLFVTATLISSSDPKEGSHSWQRMT